MIDMKARHIINFIKPLLKNDRAFETCINQASTLKYHLSNKGRSDHLKTSILIKTTASKPAIANISSSVVVQAFTIQLGEGTNLSKQKWSWRFERTWASLRPKYTPIFPGCFLNMEYSDKRTTQTAILIPAEVKRAAIFISVYTICKFQSYPCHTDHNIK